VTRGSFGWVVQELALAPVECFVLALSLMPLVDSAAGSVIATCLNDPARTDPTFALAQRLWDSPDELVRCFDPAHPLLSHGIVVVEGQARWNAVLTVPALVARELLFPGAELPASLEPVAPRAVGAEISMAAARFVAGAGDRMRIIPVIGPSGAPLAGIAAAHAAASFNTMVQPSKSLGRDQLAPVLTTAWLRGSAVYLPVDFLANAGGHDAAMERLPLSALPIAVFVGSRDIPQFKEIDGCALPPIRVPSLTYAERLECWRRVVPSLASYAALAEVARRFRYECAAIERIGAELAALDQAPTVEELLTAVRADLDFGALAQPVTPRFDLAELMLPPVQTRQIEDIIRAMNNLTRVHYEWGTARAWNECGLAALFAGPPGTGKTMAAEAIASALALPLYRIDLSQVVNKYIGETEKNLRRLFDAAESADVILFFDEADALFGKRTEVKDAHDRYANLEISYLLERMERFKGIAILATNRKRDLDEAFLRRLRFLVDFPLPGAAERRRIWQVVIPPGVDASGLDLEFLAQRFPLAGGHIRAIVFHACLQSAAEGAAHTLTMPAIIRCVQREYDKLDRASSLHQFGPYAPLVAAERTRP
jgi:vesicle-fusing ATPase